VAVSHTRGEGYRDYSAFEVTRARAFGDVRLGPDATLRLVAALEDAPRLENPGALTAEQLAADRRQAEARTVATASGKASRQGQAAATLQTATPLGDVVATVYGVARDLDNPLPFAVVAVDRLAGGARLALERDVGPVRVAVGADAAVQRDGRTNRPNEGGVPGAVLLLDQTETVRQGALSVRLQLDGAAFGVPALALEGALRGDRVRFTAADRRLDDGDQSGARTLTAVSPSAGLSVRLGPALAFASVSTAFETPTTTELVNRPDGAGGFNPDLRPQRTVGAEAGVRGVAGRVLYDVAVYALTVRDGLAPVEGENGRTFYANRSRAHHRGVEASAEWRPGPAVDLAAVYTWTRLRFGSGTESGGVSVEGRAVPGVPEHRLAVRARLSRGGLFVAPELVAATGLFADDPNAVRTEAAVTVDVAFGHAGVRARRATVAPFARVQNVFDASAVGAVVANALGGRYFEPAAGRSVHAGVAVRL
jgi:iron complex outermembrane receptor protein